MRHTFAAKKSCNSSCSHYDSRGCLPPVAAQAGGGGETSCSSRNGSRLLLARSAMQGGGRAIFASYATHHAATVAGARHVPVGRTVLVESVCRQGGTHSGTVPTGRGSKGDSREGTAGIRGVGLVFKKSGMALPATFSLTRAHRRACGGRAAAARLPPS